MQIKGWRRTSLIDYTEHIATVVFTGGCSFRCPMCHNAELVLKPHALPTYTEETLWTFLTQRAGMVTGFVVTGGEPTLQPDLPAFLRRARMHNVHVKLDTNGYHPDVLCVLLTEGLIDYVAMDIKAPPAKYAQLTGTSDVDITRIERSLGLIQESGRDYEFRTTIVPELLDADDVEAIAHWIAGAERYVLQQFRGLHTLDPHLAGQTPYAVNELRAMRKRARRWVSDTTLRGV